VWLSATPKGSHADLGLGLAAYIPLSWVFIQTIFALHCADEYYSERRRRGGWLHFPGDGNPNYWDFVYFAFGIGMAAQVASARGSAGSSPSAAFQRDHDRAHGEHRGRCSLQQFVGG